MTELKLNTERSANDDPQLNSPRVMIAQALELDRDAMSHALANVITSRAMEEIRALSSEDLIGIMHALQALIDAQLPNHRLFERFLKKLVKETGILPPYLFVSGVRRLDHIDGGGFADVWKGEYEEKAVALKVLRIFSRSPSANKMHQDFCKEAMVWRQLNHENVLPFYGVCTDRLSSQYAMVSPWLENGNMTTYLERCPGSDRLHLVEGVTSGLRYLHSLEPQIIHGDLRGANVLIDEHGRPRLADFGLARVVDSQVTAGSVSSYSGRGNIRWQAPELLNVSRFEGDGGKVTSRSDVYALASVYLEIFTGEIPFSHLRHDGAILMEVAVHDKRPPRPAEHVLQLGLDDYIWDIMQDCWKTQSTDRPSIVEVSRRITSKSISSRQSSPVSPNTSQAASSADIASVAAPSVPLSSSNEHFSAVDSIWLPLEIPRQAVAQNSKTFWQESQVTDLKNGHPSTLSQPHPSSRTQSQQPRPLPSIPSKATGHRLSGQTAPVTKTSTDDLRKLAHKKSGSLTPSSHRNTPSQGSPVSKNSSRPLPRYPSVYDGGAERLDNSPSTDEDPWIVRVLDENSSTTTPVVENSRNWTGSPSLFQMPSVAPLNVSRKDHRLLDIPGAEDGSHYSEDYSNEPLRKLVPNRTGSQQQPVVSRPILSVDTNTATSSPGSPSSLHRRGAYRVYNKVSPTSSQPGTPARTPPRRDAKVYDKESHLTWNFLPPAEDVYNRLEEYFPDHDLDKPVIEPNSRGASPTTIEPYVLPLPAPSNERRPRHRKSIRVVASEHTRKVPRHRSTKLWGSKLEEVIPFAGGGSPTHGTSQESPSPRPTFKWIRGELIGLGAYYRSYLALNATTGEMIAVKQVNLSETDSNGDDGRQTPHIRAIKLESETIKDLDHPNVVQYLGFEETPNYLSIFLEYVPGGSLSACARKHGKFDEQVTRSFAGQILSGLEYLHSKGVVHRDLKSDNILIDPIGVCKLSDFGISRRTDNNDVDGLFTGIQLASSAFWMAPEVVHSGKGHRRGFDGKVDVWSLGCVVLEMWTGRRPWHGADAKYVIYELVVNQVAPPVPRDVDLSPVAEDFRKRCFTIKPDDRPSASELSKHQYLTLRPGWRWDGNFN